MVEITKKIGYGDVMPQKKEFKSPVENTNSNSQQQSMLGQQKEYIAFTIKQSNIEAVDMISGQLQILSVQGIVIPFRHIKELNMYDI